MFESPVVVAESFRINKRGPATDGSRTFKNTSFFTRARQQADLALRTGRKAIDDFPDNVLLNIFDFYRLLPTFPKNVYSVWEWHVLAHVCRKWRQVVFASSDRLGLRLRCTPMTPAREMMDIWPPLPIVVEKPAYLPSLSEVDDDNLIAALEERDRVRMITLPGLTRRQLERFAEVMLEPFPALTHLYLGSDDEVTPALPATFMGGSAPLLQCLSLTGISFPALPNLILSPNNLTSIKLHDIPSTGHISPETMVVFLSTLTSLKSLTIEFKSPSSADLTSGRTGPPTRALLPVLIYLRFKGASEYLGDMVTQIDTPLLSNLEMVIFNHLNFDIPQLSQFINRTETLKSLNQAELFFDSRFIEIKFFHRDILSLSLHVPCSQSHSQLSSIIQLCGPPLPLPSSAERLTIHEGIVSPQKWQYDADHEQWLDILRLFPFARELYVSDTMWSLLAPTLTQDTGERTVDVLPLPCDLFLERLESAESLPETIKPFTATRKLAGHPVVFHLREGQDRSWKAVD